MLNAQKSMGYCRVCKEEYTPLQVKVAPRTKVHICSDCLEAAKHNFIWICMSCGKVYIVSKAAVLHRITDYEFKKAYVNCEDLRIIQGIHMCAECDPEGIFEHLNVKKIGRSTVC